MLSTKFLDLKKSQVVGMAGALDSSRFRTFIAMETGYSVQDDMYGSRRSWRYNGSHHKTCNNRWSSSNGSNIRKEIKEIEDRTRVAGGEIVKLFGNGSAYYAPAQSAIEMAESFIKDKKRVIPCASLCEGEFGIEGYFYWSTNSNWI